MAPQYEDALLVIDMQNDFALPGRPLCVAGALGCLPKVQEAVRFVRSHSELRVRIVWVVVEHSPCGSDVVATRRDLFDRTPGGILVHGTEGAALLDGLAPEPDDLTVVKTRWSAFFATPLDAALRAMGVNRVAIAGVQTPNCIRATAYDAIALGYDVAVLSDATASKSAAVQEANLEDMRCAAILTPTTREWAGRFPTLRK